MLAVAFANKTSLLLLILQNLKGTLFLSVVHLKGLCHIKMKKKIVCHFKEEKEMHYFIASFYLISDFSLLLAFQRETIDVPVGWSF